MQVKSNQFLLGYENKGIWKIKIRIIHFTFLVCTRLVRFFAIARSEKPYYPGSYYTNIEVEFMAHSKCKLNSLHQNNYAIFEYINVFYYFIIRTIRLLKSVLRKKKARKKYSGVKK